MSMRSILVLVALLLLAVFVAANWTAFTAPTSLSLLVATIEAPLGIVMLGVSAAIAAVFLLYALYIQSSASRETSRLAREMHAQRDLADSAEASRLTQMRTALEERMDRLSGASSALQHAVSGIAAEVAELNDHLRANGSPEVRGTPPATSRTETTARPDGGTLLSGPR